MGGRYLNKNTNNKKPRKGLKIFLIVLCVLVVLIGAIVLAGYMYLRHMLGYISSPEETNPTIVTTVPTEPAGSTEPVLEGEETSAPTETTEETWPQVVSTQNVTTIMLVGQNYREDGVEEHYLSDTMIMCTINRETNTLTMTSILRDLYVPLPAYAGHGPGRNRINNCYHLGTVWTGSTKGGMEMLSLCVEQNFGIPIDHTVEVSMDAFVQIIDLLGGVEIELTEAEAAYLTEEVGYVGDMEPGLQTLDGWEALGYARIRHIDSDFVRTERQRTVITSLINKFRNTNIWELHKIVTQILPMITTDMTTDEMMNYIWEFLPMLADLNIVSQRIPLEKDALGGAWSYRGIEVDGIGNVLEPNLWSHRQVLQQMLGYEDATE